MNWLKTQNESIEFEAASDAECTAKLRELCNDGRCWTVSVTFGAVYCRPYASARNVPRTPASAWKGYERMYWYDGQWRNRRPATEAMKQASWNQAYAASGVSDGAVGSAKSEMRKFFRRINRKLA